MIGLTATVSVITFIFISPMHSFLITLSMILTLCIVPWLSAKSTNTQKTGSSTSKSLSTAFYDYKEGDDELRRFRQRDEFKTDVMQRLKQYDTMQSKERRFLSLYDYMLNIIAMISIFQFSYWRATGSIWTFGCRLFN